MSTHFQSRRKSYRKPSTISKYLFLYFLHKVLLTELIVVGLLFNVLLVVCKSSVLSLLSHALLCIHSSLAIILKRKRKLVALLLLTYTCIVSINGLWLSLTVQRVGLQCVIVVFPDHTHLHFKSAYQNLIFLFLNKNIYCGNSKEPSQ